MKLNVKVDKISLVKLKVKLTKFNAVICVTRILRSTVFKDTGEKLYSSLIVSEQVKTLVRMPGGVFSPFRKGEVL